MLYLDLLCQWGLHIVVLMLRLAAEPRSTAGLLFHSYCPSGTILLTPHSMVWDWRVSRAGPMFFCCPRLLYPYYNLLLFFPFSSFCLLVVIGLRSLDWFLSLSLLSVYIGWYCAAGVIGLIGCISLSLSLALPTTFNNNNYYYWARTILSGWLKK